MAPRGAAGREIRNREGPRPTTEAPAPSGEAPRPGGEEERVDAILLEGFRELHRELSEEIHGLRQENRALRLECSARLREESGHGEQNFRAQLRGVPLGGDGAKTPPGPNFSGWLSDQRSCGRGGQLTDDAAGDLEKQFGSYGERSKQFESQSRRFPETLVQPEFHHVDSQLFNLQDDGVISHAIKNPMERLNMMTAVVGMCNLVYFGISIDHVQSYMLWLLVEGLTVLYFVAELIIKIRHHSETSGTLGGYFKGEGAAWNWIDAIITGVQFLVYFLSLGIGRHAMETGVLKISLFIRGLRIIRVLQDSVVMRISLLKDLTHMLIGFVKGLPSLMWVSLLIWVVIAIMAMAFRVIVRPNDTDANLLAYCLEVQANETVRRLTHLPDRLAQFAEDIEACPMYKMIGNQFCGSVSECMFTVFRCIMGDCTDMSGISLVPVLSEAYGHVFNITYATTMIFTLLGMFNVVTAVFVETVVSGISEEDRVYKKKHEWTGTAVKRKLKKFRDHLQTNHNYEPRQPGGERKRGGTVEFKSQRWTVAELTAIFQDPGSKAMLKDLEIDADDYVGVGGSDVQYNQYNKFRLTDVFDIDENNQMVDADKMMSTIARMQGLAHMDLDITTSLGLKELRRSIQALDERLGTLVASVPRAGAEGAAGAQAGRRQAPAAAGPRTASGKE